MRAERIEEAPVSIDSARLRIARLVLDDFADLKRALLTAARVSATTLAVTRVGIWSFTPDRTTLRRVALLLAWRSFVLRSAACGNPAAGSQ